LVLEAHVGYLLKKVYQKMQWSTTLKIFKKKKKKKNKKLNSEFISLGFTQLIIDQCVYIQQNTDSIVIVAIHVDDMTILASSNTLMSQVKSDLNSKFNTQDLDPVKQILDMEITRDKTTSSITVIQTQKIIERF